MTPPAPMQVNDQQSRYTSLETVLGLIDAFLTTPLDRGKQTAVRAPIDSDVGLLVERVIADFTDDDLMRLAADLGTEVPHRMRIELDLKTAFYKAYPKVAAQITANVKVRRDAAIEAPPDVRAKIGLPVAA